MRRGRGPQPGAPNAGRPKNEEREFWIALVANPKHKQALAAVLYNPDHPQFGTVSKLAHERAYGKLQQNVDVTSNGNTLEDLLAISRSPNGHG